MNVTLDWIHLATLLGAVQGFVLAGALAAHRTNRTANRLLAALVAAFTVYLIQEVYYSAGLIRDAKDGWYGSNGGTIRYGATGGVGFGRTEVTARAEFQRTERFEEVTPPFYVSLGVGFRM